MKLQNKLKAREGIKWKSMLSANNILQNKILRVIKFNIVVFIDYKDYKSSLKNIPSAL